MTNKRGDIICSAVTNLDLHDIARAAKTYGVRRYFVVTPLVDQQALAQKILDHWTTGPGAAYNPDRKEALLLARVAASLDIAIDEAQRLCGQKPAVVVTDARQRPGAISYDDLTKLIKNGKPCILVFGTAWGLTEDFIEKADFVLEPLFGPGSYNHLPVRSAAAIILDRIAGQKR
ncbi:MAG: RNA methyltransferase [Desulfatibacillaceae bacterium]|nr:RNA methyltransferase [Desulfatibacillaceae bacterium]